MYVQNINRIGILTGKMEVDYMRDLSNLERLLKLKHEAMKINSDVESENRKLSDKRNTLVESALEDFIKELAELSKYGGAGYTGIKMEFYRSSYGDHPEIIHQSENGKFRLLANPSGYSHQVVLYDSELGWDWYKEETKKYIAMNKDMILDVIEKKIAQSMTDYIGNSKAVDKNIKLKKEIEQLKNQ